MKNNSERSAFQRALRSPSLYVFMMVGAISSGVIVSALSYMASYDPAKAQKVAVGSTRSGVQQALVGASPSSSFGKKPFPEISGFFEVPEEADTYLETVVKRLEVLRRNRSLDPENLSMRMTLLSEKEKIFDALRFLMNQEDHHVHSEWFSQIGLRIVGALQLPESDPATKNAEEFYKEFTLLKERYRAWDRHQYEKKH